MNSELTESSLLILRIVSASSPATDSTRIFLDAWAALESGIESVTTSSSISDSAIRSTAPPESTGCVQYATTRAAPSSFSACAALHSVLAVSTMSSMMTQVRPFTSPITFITSDTFGCGRGALQRIDDQQHFHQAVVHRRAGGLQHEAVLAAHVLQELDHDLAVGELAHGGVAERDVQPPHHRMREQRVGVPGENHQAFVGHALYPVASHSAPGPVT